MPVQHGAAVDARAVRARRHTAGVPRETPDGGRLLPCARDATPIGLPPSSTPRKGDAGISPSSTGPASGLRRELHPGRGRLHDRAIRRPRRSCVRASATTSRRSARGRYRRRRGSSRRIRCRRSSSTGRTITLSSPTFRSAARSCSGSESGRLSVPRAGHFLQWERADLLNQVLSYFFGDLTAVA